MSNMSDEELDRNWKPNGRRPQSTMARSFSAELMDIFRIENSVSDLDSQVDKRKQTVGSANDELASLEARLAEMEARLKKSKARMSISGTAALHGASTSDDKNTGTAPALSKDDEKARSRPGTAKQAEKAPSAGNMPPTPGASEDGDRE